MKKFCICVLSAMLITSTACAMTADDLAMYHNLSCSLFGAKQVTPSDLENGWLFCDVTDTIQVAYKVDEPTLVAGCYCMDDSDLLEFLAQCCTVCYTIGKETEREQYCGAILNQFLRIRAGQPENMQPVGGLYITVRKSDDIYELVAMTKVY